MEIECDFTDDYLTGHARRVGLAGAETPDAVIARLLPTLRSDMAFESEQIADAAFAGMEKLRQGASLSENTLALTAFLDIPADQAQEIAETHYLFTD
jgi:hypothetical protein